MKDYNAGETIKEFLKKKVGQRLGWREQLARILAISTGFKKVKEAMLCCFSYFSTESRPKFVEIYDRITTENFIIKGNLLF